MGVAHEMAPPNLAHALAALSGLQAGRTDAPEARPVQPVSRELVDTTLPYLPQVVADLARFQLLTGCRPGETCIIRSCDVDRTLAVRMYRPESHKTEHQGRQRIIFVGSQAQDVLREYLLGAPEAYCFQPCDSEQKRCDGA